MLFADQVDGQPLVIPSFINDHDVVFVADESNWVYQIDAVTGAILKKVDLGRPVPQPPGCGIGANVGISSTPVIDWTTQTLFVITYVNVNPVVYPVQPTYFIHALDLVSLKDKVSPLKVVASHTQTNDAAFTFDATYEKQRPGLLFANDKVYAAFTSFCDVVAVRTYRAAGFWDGAGTERLSRPSRQTSSTTGNQVRHPLYIFCPQFGCLALAPRVTSWEM